MQNLFALVLSLLMRTLHFYLHFYLQEAEAEMEREVDLELIVPTPSDVRAEVYSFNGSFCQANISLMPTIARSVHKHKLVIQGGASLTLRLLPAEKTIFTVII